MSTSPTHNRKLEQHTKPWELKADNHRTNFEERPWVGLSRNKRFVVHAAHGPTRGRGDARLARRLYHPVRQPGQTLTSSIAPALITCLRWRGFTNECACEGAARHDLLRRHRGSSSTCLRRRPPPVCGLLNHQAFQLQWPARRRQLWILPDRTRRCSRTVLAALVVDLVPARNDIRRAALPPSDVPPHAGSPFARCHNATRRC